MKKEAGTIPRLQNILRINAFRAYLVRPSRGSNEARRTPATKRFRPIRSKELRKPSAAIPSVPARAAAQEPVRPPVEQASVWARVSQLVPGSALAPPSRSRWRILSACRDSCLSSNLHRFYWLQWSEQTCIPQPIGRLSSELPSLPKRQSGWKCSWGKQIPDRNCRRDRTRRAKPAVFQQALPRMRTCSCRWVADDSSEPQESW